MVSPARFDEQMRWLKRRRYTAVTLGQLASNWTSGQPLPPNPVAITFDDGYVGAATTAASILDEHSLKATYFVVVSLVGSTASWIPHPELSRMPLAAWPDVKRLAADGHEIGSHSMTHRHLTEVSPHERMRDLSESYTYLDATVPTFAGSLSYPHGSVSPEVARDAARAGYRAAVTVRPGHATSTQPRLALPRVPVSGDDSMVDFAWRLRWTETAGERLRSIAGGLVGRGRRR